MKKSKNATQKMTARFTALRSQILARKDLIAKSSWIETTYRKYAEKRLGPYYRLAYYDEGRPRSIYLGSSPTLVERVKRLLDELRKPRREQRWLERMRRKTRVLLAAERRNLQTLLAPLGFRVAGSWFHRRRTTRCREANEAAANRGSECVTPPRTPACSFPS